MADVPPSRDQVPARASDAVNASGGSVNTSGPVLLSADPRTKALLAHIRLCATYECPIAYFHNLDPLSELVSSLLSHRTKNADSGRAFKALRERYRTWSAVRDAPARDVQDAIRAVTWPEQKGPRLQQVLRQITILRGGVLSLDFLGDMTVPEARAWLEQLPGVGPKTSAATLAFSTLRKAALPVDSHHHRVAVRLGLIEPGVSVEKSHPLLADLLPPDWSPQQVYDHHEVFMLHGQRCCYFHSPACPRCAVLDLCPVGQVRVKMGADEPATATTTRHRETENRATARDKSPSPATSDPRRGKQREQQGSLFPELDE
jgi:endonuclease-3